jgi:hypothetical protein
LRVVGFILVLLLAVSCGSSHKSVPAGGSGGGSGGGGNGGGSQVETGSSTSGSGTTTTPSTGSSDTYAHYPWGRDGNPQPAPTVYDSDRRKFLCIADDFNKDYSECHPFKDRESCEKDQSAEKRCEWRRNSCKPYTYGECEVWLNDFKEEPGYKKILYLKDYYDRRYSDDFSKEFANYTRIDVNYQGHGPHAGLLAEMAMKVVRGADKASVIQVRSEGCSTHADREEVKREVRNQFRHLHSSARTRLSFMDVFLTGNQFTSLSGTQNRGYVYAKATQSEVTMKIIPSSESYYPVRAREESYYACRASSPTSLTHPTRSCSEHDATNKVISTCRNANGELEHEKCLKPTYLRSDGTPMPEWLYFVAPAESPTYLYFHVGDKPVTYSYADAVAACQSKDHALANFDEAKRIIESNNLFYKFDAAAGGGFIWTSSGGEESGWHTGYNLQKLDDINASTRWQYKDDTAQGFALCVPKALVTSTSRNSANRRY